MREKKAAKSMSWIDVVWFRLFANEIKYIIRSIGVRMFVGHTAVYDHFINKYLDFIISPSV